MSTLSARDLMTTDLITVPPETPVIAMARLLAERGISAVPVLDAKGAPMGMVTEADLIRRLAGEEDKPLPGSARFSPTLRAARSITPVPMAPRRAIS